MMENWKDVVGFERYQVSDLGHVRVKDIIVGARGNTTAKRKARILRPGLNGGGYPMVRLTLVPYVTKMKLVHRLVAQAFIPNPENFEAVNHKDCDRANAAAVNLEWCTDSYNNKFAYDEGYKNPNFKKIELLDDSGSLRHCFESIKEACEFLGKTQSGYVQQAMRDGYKCYGFKWRYAL
jgi:hypothetical protein